MATKANYRQGPRNKSSVALANSLIIKDGPGLLLRLTVLSTLGSAQFIQLHDSTTVPADTAIPVMVLPIPATAGSIILPLGERGKKFMNGIVICNSSTSATKTIGAADCFFEATFE